MADERSTVVAPASRSLLIVWHSRTGASRQLAGAAARGARDSLRDADGDARQDGARADGVRIDCVHARAVDAQRVCAASGYLFVAPENLASLSGVMKDFFDRTYYGVLGRVEGRPYAVIIAAGSDGQGAARQVERIATGWRLRKVADPAIVITRAQSPEAILAPKQVGEEDLARAAEIGAGLAQGLALGIF
jgi:multimeric flavodoxin WrbA